MEKISSSFPEPLCLSGCSILHIRNGTELPSLIGLLIASFCATQLLANYIFVNVTRTERTGPGEIHGRSKVTQTRRPWGSRCQDEVPKAFWWGYSNIKRATQPCLPLLQKQIQGVWIEVGCLNKALLGSAETFRGVILLGEGQQQWEHWGIDCIYAWGLESFKNQLLHYMYI